MINLRRTLEVSFKYRQRITTEIVLSRCRHSNSHPTVGMIVIGDEILKAQVKDSNSFYACKLLYQHGVKVKKISVIGDNIQDIANEIQKFSKKYEYVITSGGIGPTHDDLTYEAVAAAFDDTLHCHPVLVDIIKNYFGYENLSSPGFKMAKIPTKATLVFGVNEDTGKRLAYPCMVLQNVYVFPGSPVFFEMSFRSVCKKLFSGNKSFATDAIYINAIEESFADVLSAIAQEHPSVRFGSYPEHNRYYKVRVTIESESEEETKSARKKVCDLIPRNVLVDYDHASHVDCVGKKFYQNSETVSVYLDGSPESTAMVHLARTATAKLQNYRVTLQAFCFEFDNLRPGMNEFLREITHSYNIELSILPYEDHASGAKGHLNLLVSGLQTLLLGKRRDGVRNVIYEELESFLNKKDFEHIQQRDRRQTLGTGILGTPESIQNETLGD